jgi:hypothetical protein
MYGTCAALLGGMTAVLLAFFLAGLSHWL